MTADAKRVDLTGWPVNNNPVPVNWRGKIIHVRPILSLEELREMIREVISYCYDEYGDTMVPEFIDYYFRASVVRWYSNAVLPEDPEETNRLMYLTDIYDVIAKKASASQITTARRIVEITIFGYKYS